MKKIGTTCLAIILVLMAALSFAGCSNTGGNNKEPSPASLVTAESGGVAEDAAPDESETGSVVVYTALEDELTTEYLKDFKDRHPGIDVRLVRESTGIITAKMLAEKDNPVADAVWGTAASSMMVLDDQGMLEPYAPEGVENILPNFKSDKPVPTWVGIDAWETAFVINGPELEKLGMKAEDINGYQDLLNPKLKGHIEMPNPNSSGTGLLTVTGILQLNGKGTDEGWDYLVKLDRNVSQYVHSGSKPAKDAAAGECAVGVSFGYAGISQKAKGAPVETVFPKEGSGWDLEANALMKKDGINPAAETFLDWAISDSAMELYKGNYPIICNGKGGAYEGFSADPVEQLISNDFVWVANNRQDILDEWMKRFDAKSAPVE